MTGDRVFGLVALVVALAFMVSATQIQTSFLADPVGPRTFPLLIGAVGAISSLIMIFRPDPNPTWPALKTWGVLAIAALVLVICAYALKPLGFILPATVAAAVLSYQISPRLVPALLAGAGLSIGLFALFRFALGLSLAPFPPGLFG